MLSNTATPYYYGKFKEEVISGRIPVNRHISDEMNRIEWLISNPDYYYDEHAMDGYVKYCENELTLTDGSDLKLLDSFKLWAEQIFCWFYFEDRSVYVPNEVGHGHYITKRIKKRLTNKQYLIVARGAAKSMYGSTIHSYFLNIDTSTKEQIATAPTMRQAEEVMSPIRTSIIRSRGPLFKFLTEGSIHSTTGSKLNKPKLASTKVGIENFLTGSKIEIRPMSINKLQGARCKIVTIDEWLSGDTREDIVGAVEQGASKIPGYLIVAISSEGTVRNGVGDTMKIELEKILKGEYVNPHVSIFWYCLDSIQEVNDPEMWVKANPNLGFTVQYDTYHLDVERAEKSPAARNDILAKRFGLPMEGFTYFFSYQEIQCHRPQNFDGMDCAMGCDLSQGNDFCAFSFWFPLRGGKFGLKSICYISELAYHHAIEATREKYDEFIKEGSLVVQDGSILDMELLYDDLDDYILTHGYNVICVGYDPYNSKGFIDRWAMENSPFGILKVPQGVKTETVPLGEIKNLAEARMVIFDQSIVNFTMGNCVVMRDTNGGMKLMKLRYEAKIDVVSAAMDAHVAYKANRESFE